MATQRTVAPPLLSYYPRPALDSAVHPRVDAVLKQLKSCTRRLQTALSFHRNELQVLERLYYKGKNQHRTALFWQRVAEMRRYGDRLEGMEMYSLVEVLRLAFWGDPSLHSSKVLKGPWTHAPDTKSLLFVLKRCSECRILVGKTRERLQEAYRSFSLMMQTGAFVQLILTLVAIASRLDMLLAEVLSALEVCSNACYQALQALDPAWARSAQRFSTGVARCIRLDADSAVRVVPAIIQRRDGLDEDLGSTVQCSRASHADVSQISLQVDNSSIVDDQMFADDAWVDPSLNVVRPSIVTTERMTAKLTETKAAISHTKELSAPIREGKHKSAVGGAKQQLKAKTKKRDEIDDIFGF